MDLRRLPRNASPRRFGRRATDAAVSARFYAATFVAQVAGLSQPSRGATGAYAVEEPLPPTGLVTNTRV